MTTILLLRIDTVSLSQPVEGNCPETLVMDGWMDGHGWVNERKDAEGSKVPPVKFWLVVGGDGRPKKAKKASRRLLDSSVGLPLFLNAPESIIYRRLGCTGWFTAR